MTADLLALDLPALGRMLRSGETTPIALTESALARLDTTGRQLNAVATLTPERALADANRAADELAVGIDRGPLHGIPYGAKDLLAAEGYPTTWGATPFKGQIFTEDAAVIERLTAAGAVLVGKLAMVELAGGFGYEQPHAAATGPGRNAWDRERWAGGSSSGSGAAVAARLVPFAIGSETWGSITNPGCLNGITGFRPTYGSVSRRGAMALSWTMDKLGPMAPTAETCALVLAAIAGPDAADPTTLLAPRFAPDSRDDGFRFGVLRDAAAASEPEVAANFEAALAVLAEFGSLTEIGLPDFPYDEAAALIVQAEAASAFEEFIRSGGPEGLTALEDRIGLLEAMTMPAVDYLRALRIRRVAGRALGVALGRFDAIVAPTQPRVAPPIGDRFDAYYEGSHGPSLSAAGNLCGLPAITVPNGFGAFGMPTGLELMGRAGADGAILAAAAAFQRRTEWHTCVPLAWDA